MVYGSLMSFSIRVTDKRDGRSATGGRGAGCATGRCSGAKSSPMA